MTNFLIIKNHKLVILCEITSFYLMHLSHMNFVFFIFASYFCLLFIIYLLWLRELVRASNIYYILCLYYFILKNSIKKFILNPCTPYMRQSIENKCLNSLFSSILSILLLLINPKSLKLPHGPLNECFILQKIERIKGENFK